MTTTVAAAPLLVPGVNRVDGRLKVTGAAHYPSDVSWPDMAHAALVRSTIAAGTIARLDTARAAAAPGVLAVITHQNAGRLHKAKRTLQQILYPPPPPPLQDAKISHHGQYVAMVVAETRQQAAAAARLVEVGYDRGQPVLTLEDAAAKPGSNPYLTDMKRGNVTAAMEAAEVTVEGTFTTPAQTHNPLGPFTTVARWDGGTLTVYDSTQNPFNVRAVLAAAFGLAEQDVRVLSPYVGGGFGAGLRSWPHSILAALAARTVKRPVRLSLSRPQMFTGIGQRPSTVQHLKIAATRDAKLVAIDHEGTSTASMAAAPPARKAPLQSLPPAPGDPYFPLTIGTTAAPPTRAGDPASAPAAGAALSVLAAPGLLLLQLLPRPGLPLLKVSPLLHVAPLERQPLLTLAVEELDRVSVATLLSLPWVLGHWRPRPGRPKLGMDTFVVKHLYEKDGPLVAAFITDYSGRVHEPQSDQ